VVNTIRAAIQASEGIIQKEGAKENILRAEEAKLREQLADLKKRNEEWARKVALYENPELEDAMQERILLAVDRKEKQLQAELKDKIGILMVLLLAIFSHFFTQTQRLWN
jgi:predicted nuclease with TOPRIM domain